MSLRPVHLQMRWTDYSITLHVEAKMPDEPNAGTNLLLFALIPHTAVTGAHYDLVCVNSAGDRLPPKAARTFAGMVEDFLVQLRDGPIPTHVHIHDADDPDDDAVPAFGKVRGSVN